MPECECVPGHHCDCWDYRAARATQTAGLREAMDMLDRHSVFDPEDGNYRVEAGTWNEVRAALATTSAGDACRPDDRVGCGVHGGAWDEMESHCDATTSAGELHQPSAEFDPQTCTYCGLLWPCEEALYPTSAGDADGLAAAWQEAEAALPEGWHLSVDTGSGKPRAHACPARFGADPQVNADCPTPAAALLALAARLRETPR